MSEKAPTRFVILYHGEVVATATSEAAAWRWLHRHQPQSIEWALRYGGYRIEPDWSEEEPEVRP